MRILLFGDGAWAANSLMRLQQTERAQIVGVVLRSSPSDDTLARVAQEFGLRVFRPENVNEAEFVELVRRLNPDLNLSISYNQILQPPVIQTAPLGFVNFHAGKLPLYRGRNVINWALINGEKEIGLTAHFVDEGIDTGDIILQHTLPIAWTDNYGDVLMSVVDYFPAFVDQTVERLVSGDYERRPQGVLEGSYFAGRETGDEWLDWNDTSFNLHNKVRAISRPGPGARTILGFDPVIVWRAFYDPTWPNYLATPGQVVGRCLEGVLVKTANSTLLIKEVQFVDGPTIVPRWPIGTRLGVNAGAQLEMLLGRLKLINPD
jgi:methionyl-tRNA formyltransferase